MRIQATKYDREDGVCISRSDLDPNLWSLFDLDARVYNFESSQFTAEGNFLLEDTALTHPNSPYLTTFSNAMRTLETVESVTKSAT